MGCAPSRHVNPIDAALVQALHAAKKRRGKKDFTFNELLLKFSSMSGGFRKAREYFDSMDLNHDKLIDLQEFMTMVRGGGAAAAPPRRGVAAHARRGAALPCADRRRRPRCARAARDAARTRQPARDRSARTFRPRAPAPRARRRASGWTWR
jgi:hypothetical protein